MSFRSTVSTRLKVLLIVGATCSLIAVALLPGRGGISEAAEVQSAKGQNQTVTYQGTPVPQGVANFVLLQYPEMGDGSSINEYEEHVLHSGTSVATVSTTPGEKCLLVRDETHAIYGSCFSEKLIEAGRAFVYVPDRNGGNVDVTGFAPRNTTAVGADGLNLTFSHAASVYEGTLPAENTALVFETKGGSNSTVLPFGRLGGMIGKGTAGGSAL